MNKEIKNKNNVYSRKEDIILKLYVYVNHP